MLKKSLSLIKATGLTSKLPTTYNTTKRSFFSLSKYKCNSVKYNMQSMNTLYTKQYAFFANREVVEEDYIDSSEVIDVQEDIVDNRNEFIKSINEAYPEFKLANFKNRDFENVDYENDVAPQINNLISNLGFKPEEVAYMAKTNRSILFKDNNNPKRVFGYSTKNKKMPADRARALMIRNPRIINLQNSDFKETINTIKEVFKLNDEDALHQILESPKILTQNSKHKILEIIESLKLGSKFTTEEILDLWKKFPYLLCCKSDKIRAHQAILKCHTFTQEETKEFLKLQPEILACEVKNQKGLISNLNQIGVGAKRVKELLFKYPELILQNRQDIINGKVRLLLNEKVPKSVIKYLFVDHTDIFLKSMASYESKIEYLKHKMELNLQKEKSFPYVLAFNYNSIIRPRGDLLFENKTEANLLEAFTLSGEDFCNKYNISMDDLRERKNARSITSEKDILWQSSSNL